MLTQTAPKQTNRQEADRQLRAYEQQGDYLVLAAEKPGEFYVMNGKGATYTATMDRCTCPDFQRRKLPCKHSHMVRFAMEAEAATKPAPAATRRRDDEFFGVAAEPALDPYHAARARSYGLDAEGYREMCHRHRDELFG